MVCLVSFLYLLTCAVGLAQRMPGIPQNRAPVRQRPAPFPGFLPGPLTGPLSGPLTGPPLGLRAGPDPGRPFVTGSSLVYATCYFNDSYTPIKGRVDFMQDMQMTPPRMQVRVQAWGLPESTMNDAEHAMHVHQWGDTTRNCYSAGPYFDLDRQGGPNAIDRTARTDGYFGNLRQTNNGMIDTTFIVQNLMLTGERGLMGRSVVLKEGPDDMGRGQTPESLQTGNAGAPIACCVIGYADSWNWNHPILVNGDFPNPVGLVG
ncbi:superoxide dismutase [Cu-Zn]-like [Dreissena polymorpha]|uniref:Superoxide dismutase copper/zinc binding domain-containing protein n=1 Tax=Dreissena polymorpha TaxID=45954 RepID=A0A9D4BHK4_DREPO|nr:superoxide dismutase [Cu-Zn]-like [Dreissena polymorpha]KAH3695272.1 hypothetical protein DPMN_082729 [Dreissena polymorpha]